MKNLNYAVLVVPLTEAEGGGYMALVPDLHGCMADGETPSEALEGAEDAISAWLSAQADMNRSAPEPGSSHREADDQMQILDEYMEKQDALIESQEELIAKQTKMIERLQAEIAEIKSPVRMAVRAGGVMVASKTWESVLLRRTSTPKPRPKLVPTANKG
jgi:antitoxin HicB